MTGVPGRLILVPAPLAQGPSPPPWLCEADRTLVGRLSRFYVETPKTARAWLKALPVAAPLQSLQLRALPAAGANVDWRDWLAPLAAGESAVLVDAGPLPNPGYRVAADQEALPVHSGVLQVRVRAVPPPAGSIQAQVLTNACLYLRLGRADYREATVEVVR